MTIMTVLLRELELKLGKKNHSLASGQWPVMNRWGRINFIALVYPACFENRQGNELPASKILIDRLQLVEMRVPLYVKETTIFV